MRGRGREQKRRVTGRQKSTHNVNESIGNLTLQTHTQTHTHTGTTESIRPAGGHPLQCSPDPHLVQQNERCTENAARPPPPTKTLHSTAQSSRVSRAGRPSLARACGSGAVPPPLWTARRRRGLTSNHRHTETTAAAAWQDAATETEDGAGSSMTCRTPRCKRKGGGKGGGAWHEESHMALPDQCSGGDKNNTATERGRGPTRHTGGGRGGKVSCRDDALQAKDIHHLAPGHRKCNTDTQTEGGGSPVYWTATPSAPLRSIDLPPVH